MFDFSYLQLIFIFYSIYYTKVVFKTIIIHFLLFSFLAIYTGGKLGFGEFHAYYG